MSSVGAAEKVAKYILHVVACAILASGCACIAFCYVLAPGLLCLTPLLCFYFIDTVWEIVEDKLKYVHVMLFTLILIGARILAEYEAQRELRMEQAREANQTNEESEASPVSHASEGAPNDAETGSYQNE
jgi:hypothetical protein